MASTTNIFHEEAALFALMISNFSKRSCVLISGCFDAFHKGHGYILDEIQKQNPNKIIVLCLNSDDYIKSKKNRVPIFTFEQRKLEIKKYNPSIIVVKIEDSPIEVIKTLKPKTIYAGSDYKLEQVVGYNESKEWGGKVKIIERFKDYSTTKIYNALRNA